MERIERIDKNGTKYMVSNTCRKCGGKGTIRMYGHIYSGICFLCNGSGIHEYHWKEYTPEYAKKLADKRLQKAIKTAPERNEKLWSSIGLSDNGSAWVVINKFAKSADMKELGARWNPYLGWFFKEEHDGTFFMSADDLGQYYADGTWAFKENIGNIVDSKRDSFLPKSESEYVGEIGQKITLTVTFERSYSYEASFGYNTTTVYILKFKNGYNTIVWKTSSYNEFEEGKEYSICGIVNEHKEYRGDKQTILTRCKVVAI